MENLIKKIHHKATRLYTMNMPSPLFKTDLEKAVTQFTDGQILKVLEDIWDNDTDKLPVVIGRKIRELQKKTNKK